MGIVLEKEQVDAFDKIRQWYHRGNEPRFVLLGYAGTGKSTTVARAIEELGFRVDEVAFVAYTGKASLVLRQRGVSATTIHRLIYQPREVPLLDEEGRVVIDERTKLPKMTLEFVRQEALPPNIRLIVVDEASMVNDDLQDDLESYGVPVLYCGDHGQLQPITGTNRVLTCPDAVLEQIRRQAEGSAIIQASFLARRGKNIPWGKLGDGFYKMEAGRVTADLMSRAHQIICGKHTTRKAINEEMRGHYGFHGLFPVTGEKVICTSNDWDIGLVNGQIGTFTEVKSVDTAKQRIYADFEDETGVWYHDLRVDGRIFMGDPPKRSRLAQFDFGYAITCHKAQGSQWGNTMIVDEKLADWRENYKRWLYTAVTRSIDNCILVTEPGRNQHYYRW